MGDEFVPYPKIDSIFKRDKSDNKFILFDWAKEEFAFLRHAEWIWTEKVDGTNTRVQLRFTPDGECLPESVEYRGRTDRAQWSQPVADMLDRTFITNEWFWRAAYSVFVEKRDVHEPLSVILYGESYGAGIQKGAAYSPVPKFVLFDVLINGQWWMPRGAVKQIGADLVLDVVPLVMVGSIYAAIRRVTSPGFVSKWYGVKPEGLVGVPSVPLYDRRQRRLMTKVKVCDFEHLVGDNRN